MSAALICLTVEAAQYHLRFRIPSDISTAIPSREIVKSPKTKENNTARIAVLPYQQGIFKPFS
jgi:hypothetical protein